jgi:hypothetical protein
LRLPLLRFPVLSWNFLLWPFPWRWNSNSFLTLWGSESCVRS